MAKTDERLICGTRANKNLGGNNGHLLHEVAPRLRSKLHVAERRATLKWYEPELQPALDDDEQFPGCQDVINSPLFKGTLVVAQLTFQLSSSGNTIALSAG